MKKIIQTMASIYKFKIILFCFIFLSAFMQNKVDAQWQATIDFTEAIFDLNADGANNEVLVDPTTMTTTFEVDALMPDVTSACTTSGFGNYMEGQDGVNDIRITATMFRNTNAWGTDVGRLDQSGGVSPTGLSHNASLNPNNGISQENDYSYVVYQIDFIDPSITLTSDVNLNLRTSSNNGSSELYEYAIYGVNGALTPAMIALIPSYSNDIYNGHNGATQQTISDFITGAAGISAGGFHPNFNIVAPGIVSVDDFNTYVDPNAPEEPGCNPAANDGANPPGTPCPNLGLPTNNPNPQIASADLGLAAGTAVNSLTIVLGLFDVCLLYTSDAADE